MEAKAGEFVQITLQRFLDMKEISGRAEALSDELRQQQELFFLVLMDIGRVVYDNGAVGGPPTLHSGASFVDGYNRDPRGKYEVKVELNKLMIFNKNKRV